MSAAAPDSGFNLRRFLLSGSGWPYLLVPFIPIAIALELAHAEATLIFVTSAAGVIPTAALIGSILGNILLVMGAAMLIGGRKRERQKFNATAANVQALMLLLAVVALIAPP